jgi:hypothetical protein
MAWANTLVGMTMLPGILTGRESQYMGSTKGVTVATRAKKVMSPAKIYGMMWNG